MNEYTFAHENSPNDFMLVHREKAMCILECVQIHHAGTPTCNFLYQFMIMFDFKSNQLDVESKVGVKM